MKRNSVEWGVFIQKETVNNHHIHLLFLFQEQAATPETSTTPAWSRLLMRMVPIWWETWLTSVDWWLLDWCPHHLTTVTLFPRQHTRRCVAAALASSSTGKVWMDGASAKTNHFHFLLYCHYFCISTLISLAFCFLHCILPLPFSRCAECGCQGQGDYVQLGVFDQSGCVSWAAGRTTQSRYCRYISLSPFKLSIPFHLSCHSLVSPSVSLRTCFLLAGVAVALKQAMSPEFKAYQTQVLANCKALSSALIDYGYKIVTGKYHRASLR